MKPWFLFLIIVVMGFKGKIHAQLSGVINQYTSVTNISCNQVTVLNPSFLSIGDRVLIIQMKGAEINTSNSASFGMITNYHGCGNYEFANVTAISGNIVQLQYQLLNAYEITGRVQLIRVPQYTNATVVNTLTAQDWNGSTGGVLVMELSGTLTLNAPISLNGKGFRGSFSCSNPDGGCGNFPNYFYAVSSGYGAEKGEGIAEAPANMNGGRGALGNGGGGGNKHNTGGGGGSNGSRGGRGGDQASFCGTQPIGGEGGMALNYGMGRLFMGGGGGSPDHNDQVGTSGSNGGGIIIIRAATIQSNNTYIESNGGDVLTLSNNIGDGAGGGGAGGMIVLDVNTLSGNMELRVNGGNGGNQQTTYGACFGPGGGGGTGAIQISGSAIPTNVTTQFIPGTAGVDLNSSSSCFSQTYGAAAGQFSPVYVFNATLPESHTAPDSLDIGQDIETCDVSALIDPGITAASYWWSTGETTPTITVISSGDYWLSVSSGSGGCLLTDTISVDLGSMSVDAGPDQTICQGENTTLHAVSSAGNAGVGLSWDNGVTDNVPFSPQVTRVYTVIATDQNAGCSATDSVTVTVIPPPAVAVSPSVTTGCAPLTVTFSNASTDCSNAVWEFSDGTVLTGCGNQQHTFLNPGCYALTLNMTSAFGCNASANFPSVVCVSSSPNASFYPSPVILNSENESSTMVNTSSGGTRYEWNFGNGASFSDEFSPVQTYPTDAFDSYTIRLIVTNEDGCMDTAFAHVYVEGGLVYYVPNAFTPDGNEFNQLFKPVFTSGFDPDDYNFQVYNRWGEIVFESNDPVAGWDGTYLDKLSPEGIYAWRIEFKNSKNDVREVVHGHLSLLK